MTNNDAPHNEKRVQSRIQLALPAKITGIVFWGMVLVGLLVTFFLLQDREKELVAEYKTSAILLAYDVKSILEQKEGKASLDDSFEYLFQHAKVKYFIEAITFKAYGKLYEFGSQTPGQEHFQHNFRIHNAITSESEVVELNVFMPGLKQAISDLRKKILLYIAFLVFSFGLILQQVLQKVLSKPFINMVVSAEKFAEGDSSVRFDEKRQDEFGYLAKFINRALDSIMHQQQALEASRRALFEEKERAEVTLHSIIDGVITTTDTGHILYMNPVAERLTGWSNAQANNVVLNNVVKIVHEDGGR